MVLQEGNYHLNPPPQGPAILASVVYSRPRSAHDQACRTWGLDVFDARTGQEIVTAAYAPGP